MKVSELNESAPSPTTSVQSIGQVEFAAFSDHVGLYRRNKDNRPVKVAKVKRKDRNKWTFVKTESWDEFEMPHFGNLKDTDEYESIEEIFRKRGIRYDSLKRLK